MHVDARGALVEREKKKAEQASPLREGPGRRRPVIFFDNLGDDVRLALAQRPALLYAHHVADIAELVLVVRPDLTVAPRIHVEFRTFVPPRDAHDRLLGAGHTRE